MNGNIFRCFLNGFIIVCLGAIGMSMSAANALELVKDGKPAATIVIPATPTHWNQLAANWLQQYVEKSSGAKLPIVAESNAPAAPLISVGPTALARKAGIKTDDLKYDGCKMIVKDNVLYLIGRDLPGIEPKAEGYGAGARGTVRAVAKFAEDFLGVRWFTPTTEGERLMPMKTIAVPDSLNIAFNPDFGYAHGRYLYGYGLAGIANNFRTAILIKSYGGHSYYDWVPEKQHFKDHPEYFRLTAAGKRVSDGNHLCTSNPQVRELLKKGLFEQLDKDYEWCALGQTDGYTPYTRCQCPTCEAMDRYGELDKLSETLTALTTTEWVKIAREYPCERLLLAHKWIIDEAKKKYPNKKVHMIVYGPTAMPSKKINFMGDNVVLEICGDGAPEIIEAWKGKASAFTVYVCWFDITVGYGMDVGMTPADISKRLHYLHENGCIGIYFGGIGENWGFMGPTFYVAARMMGDINLDYKALVKEYCDGLYGNASAEMQDFYDVLYSRICIPPATGASVQDMQFVRYPANFLLTLNELLSAAEMKADTERGKNFIHMTRDQLDFNRLLTQAMLAYRNWKLSQTDQNWQEIRQAVEAFDTFRERVLKTEDAFVEKYYPGHGHVCNYLTSQNNGQVYYSDWRSRRKDVLAKPVKGNVIGYGENAISIPLTLNFDRPPQMAILVASRTTTAPKLDGKLDDSVWTKAQTGVLAPMLVNQKETPSKVRLLYDSENLYVGFDFEEPFIDKIAAKSVGRDGPVWNLDCGEILLAPDCSRRRYYHYIISPAQDALYDDRTGYKTLKDQDAAWNGPCEYAYDIDAAGKRWSLEVKIPFATLGVAAPKPGAWWLGNFGRERQTSKLSDHSQGDLFLWSQEESMGFVDPAAFGKIEFGN